MELANYKACICEGSAENAIMDILLDYNLLIFNREEMIEEEVIRCREAKKFEEKYLRKGFKDKISVIRILDSRGENFKLSKAYAGKVDVINVVTAPEIEMLIIHNENRVCDIVKIVKQETTYCLWQKYGSFLSKQYWKKRIFWSDGYFACSIGEVSSATIQKYIESQG